MPSLIDLRRRIRAVKSTQQITKAMKMIAASRLRRAQARMTAARPFADRMHAVLSGLSTRVDTEMHPLFHVPQTDSGRPLLIVITGDRGLCGSFNSNVIKAAGQFIFNQQSSGEVTLGLVGRKGREFFGRRGFDVLCELTGIFQQLHFDHAAAIADTAMEAFIDGKVSSVHLVYNEFKSVIAQRVVTFPLLPIVQIEGEESGAGADYLYEPEPARIFSDLLPRHVQVQVFRAMLESNAAFYAAQMMAMDSATRNSAEMIEDLTLYMNKVRQAAITREIIEVVSGAAAT
jgi:F-type H+-transporting ATPase subunit gamma